MQQYSSQYPDGPASSTRAHAAHQAMESPSGNSPLGASAQHVLIAARFKHLELSQWESDVREIALSAMVPTVTPKSIKQALNGSEAQAWEKAIIEEFRSFDTPVGVHGAKCMEVVDASELPPKACILGSKYEFKWKEPIGDCPARARARLCICGNQELLSLIHI